MKTRLQIFSLLLALTALHSHISSAHAQGSLTPPPGAPAPTMKTLDQIEARTAITNKASLVTISQPGSYYLTGNLTVSTGDAIQITTNGVTLDLNGFTIRSTAASATGTGILFTNGVRSDITIYNGHILGSVTNNGSGVYGGDGSGLYSGGGFGSGIASSGGSPMNVLVSRISVAGVRYDGIGLGTGEATVAEFCVVRTTGGSGIGASTIKSCVAKDCWLYAIRGEQVSDCRGESSGTFGVGVSATTALNCYGGSIAGVGIVANTANYCAGYRSGGTAIQATVANGCSVISGTTSISFKYNMP